MKGIIALAILIVFTLICDYVIKVRIETDGMKNIFIIKMTAIKRSNLEAPPRFELGVRVLQTRALPLGYGAVREKSPYKKNGAGNEIRTRDICLGKATLYH